MSLFYEVNIVWSDADVYLSALINRYSSSNGRRF